MNRQRWSATTSAVGTAAAGWGSAGALWNELARHLCLTAAENARGPVLFAWRPCKGCSSCVAAGAALGTGGMTVHTGTPVPRPPSQVSSAPPERAVKAVRMECMAQDPEP